MANLTEEENQELKERPVSTQWTDFTEIQIKTRQQIAEKIIDNMFKTDETLTDEMKEIYKAYPPWKFYKSDGLIKRIYGVGICVDDKDEDKNTKDDKDEDKNTKDRWIAYTASCHIMCTNLTVGGTPCKDLQPIDAWSNEDLSFIRMNDTPGAFLDPLGFLLFGN